LKGYDFPVLENYQAYVHNVAEVMGIEVADGYVTYISIHLDSVFVGFVPPVSQNFFLFLFFFESLAEWRMHNFAFDFSLDIALEPAVIFCCNQCIPFLQEEGN
jgi:hypothetical protein